jgi:hypothetical protein
MRHKQPDGIANIEFRRLVFGAHGIFEVWADGCTGFYRFYSLFHGASQARRVRNQLARQNQQSLHAPRTTQHHPALSGSFTLFYGILR